VIDCNEWKTEKRHECSNMGKVKDSNYDGTSMPERDIRNIRPVDFCLTEIQHKLCLIVMSRISTLTINYKYSD